MGVDDHITDPALVSVLETSRAAREQALAVIDLVIAKVAASGNAPTPEDLREISKQQKLLITNVAQLRGLHRSAHLRARETKAKTAEARHEVDVLHLQLQNQNYEQRHLEGEIMACEGFEHSYQKLPLVSVDEFLSIHPGYARDPTMVDENETEEEYENALMVARINHEKAERERLEQQRLELQKRKQKLIAENKKRRDDLANLDKDLEKFIDAAKPIQKMFEKVV